MLEKSAIGKEQTMEFDEKKAERRELIYAMLMSVAEYPSAEWLFSESKGADDDKD